MLGATIGLISDRRENSVGSKEPDNVFIPSVVNRMNSFVTDSYYRITKPLLNLLISVNDPTPKAFKAECKASFFLSKYQKTFGAAVAKMDQIFASVISNSSVVKEWHLLHEKSKVDRDLNKIWEEFSNSGGICLGSSVAMASHILEQGQTFTVDQLKQIEGGDDFTKASQVVQLIAFKTVGYNKTMLEKGPVELVKLFDSLDPSDQLAALGLTLEEYESSECQHRIKPLMQLGVVKEDLNGRTVKELVGLEFKSYLSELRLLKLKVVIRNAAENGLNLVKNFALLPSENLLQLPEMPTAELPEKLMQVLKFPNFKAVAIINVKPAQGSEGHALLLQIDNKEGVYILYDTYRGFYQWNDLETCLADLKVRLESQGYVVCQEAGIFPIPALRSRL